MYADGGVFLEGGSFNGLQYVYNLLKSRAYHSFVVPVNVSNEAAF
jgi:hypothetical protein